MSRWSPDSRCSESWAWIILYHLMVVLAPGPCWSWTVTVLTSNYKGYFRQLHACRARINSSLDHCKHLHFVFSTKYADMQSIRLPAIVIWCPRRFLFVDRITKAELQKEANICYLVHIKLYTEYKRLISGSTEFQDSAAQWKL